MTRFYWVLAAVAVVGMIVVGYGLSGGGSAATEPVDLAGVEEDMGALISLAQGITLGDENAPLTIAEFGDYQCPGCREFSLGVKPQLDFAFVQKGLVKFVFYDFPLISIHAHAFLAARASRCALDQGKYWEYHEALFTNQSRWAGMSEVVGTFVGYAGEVGMDEDEFGTCLRSDKYADVVTANMRLAMELGLTGTPTVMVSQGQGMARRVQRYDFPSIQAVVEEMLAQGGN